MSEAAVNDDVLIRFGPTSALAHDAAVAWGVLPAGILVRLSSVAEGRFPMAQGSSLFYPLLFCRSIVLARLVEQVVAAEPGLNLFTDWIEYKKQHVPRFAAAS